MPTASNLRRASLVPLGGELSESRRECPMSEDWPQGWYQNEKPNAGEPTRDAPVQAAPGAFGSTGFGNGGYGSRGYGNGGTAGGWATQPPPRGGPGRGARYGG